MERKWWTLIVVCAATFMLLLDITIVNVALPEIAEALARELLRPAVGDRRLRADARVAAADDRLARPTCSAGGACSRSASSCSRSPRCCARLAERRCS